MGIGSITLDIDQQAQVYARDTAHNEALYEKIDQALTTDAETGARILPNFLALTVGLDDHAYMLAIPRLRDVMHIMQLDILGVEMAAPLSFTRDKESTRGEIKVISGKCSAKAIDNDASPQPLACEYRSITLDTDAQRRLRDGDKALYPMIREALLIDPANKKYTPPNDLRAIGGSRADQAKITETLERIQYSALGIVSEVRGFDSYTAASLGDSDDLRIDGEYCK
jgi:hypothetical protein